MTPGAVKTILFFAQPESLTSTRIYPEMLLHGGGRIDDECDFEQAVLDEDLALRRVMRAPGLPLRMRDELHVRADLLGVHPRRILGEFRAQS